jgi:hypothetical protein
MPRRRAAIAVPPEVAKWAAVIKSANIKLE